MDYTIEERNKLIKEACLKETSKNPLVVIKNIMHKDFIKIHGPEHHILDGSAFLVAFKNAGGNIDLERSLDRLAVQGVKMPGAICGYWAACGSTLSIGAALAIIEETGPLTSDSSWGSHMEYTSSALASLGKVGGPRCCKRNAFLSLLAAIEYANGRFKVQMETGTVICEFHPLNLQCIKERCPFYSVKKFLKR